jgi:ABC-type spermidine/putrescine transport system permease subunit II
MIVFGGAKNTVPAHAAASDLFCLTQWGKKRRITLTIVMENIFPGKFFTQLTGFDNYAYIES